MEKTNTYLLEESFKIAMIENNFKQTDVQTLNEQVNSIYEALENNGSYKAKNGLTFHKNGTATRD